MDHYQEVMLALSESVMKNRLNRPLAVKSRWRHIWLAIKSLYLGTMQPRYKSYYWKAIRMSWSLFQNPSWKNHLKSPPIREITMTSHPACNKTSLSQKPCIADKKVIMDHYQEVMVALSESVMKNHLKRHLAEKLLWRHIRLAIKPRYLRNHASQIITIMKSWSLSNFY